MGVNYTDATTLTGACAPEQAVHRPPDAGRCVITDAVAAGPAMVDTARWDQADPAAADTVPLSMPAVGSWAAKWWAAKSKVTPPLPSVTPASAAASKPLPTVTGFEYPAHRARQRVNSMS